MKKITIVVQGGCVTDVFADDPNVEVQSIIDLDSIEDGEAKDAAEEYVQEMREKVGAGLYLIA